MPKKLKKIPYDVVSYVLIEAEDIKDANDKQMISSYCLHKLELVNWYLELLENGSKKYIVPHSKAQLETLRDQLMAAHKTIMATKIPDPRTRPLIDIRPLAKLSKAVKVADTSNQGKAKSKAISAVAVTFRQDTESLNETDGVLHKNTLFGNLSVFPAFLLCQWMCL